MRVSAAGVEKPSWCFFAHLGARWGSGLGGCSRCIPVVPNRDLRIPPAPSLSLTWDSPSPEPKSPQGKQAELGARRIPCRDKSCPLPLQPIRPWDNSTSVSPPAAARTAVPPRPFCPRGGGGRDAPHPTGNSQAEHPGPVSLVAVSRGTMRGSGRGLGCFSLPVMSLIAHLFSAISPRCLLLSA